MVAGSKLYPTDYYASFFSKKDTDDYRYRGSIVTPSAACHTGAFLIATNDNRSCRISLSAGRVTHCAFGRDYGDAAFDKIAEIQEGSYSFVKNAPQPTKARMQVNNKQAIDQLMHVLNQQAENDLQETSRQKLPSGLTDKWKPYLGVSISSKLRGV